MSVECRVCTAQTDAFLCGTCAAELEQALAELPALIRDLDVTVTRQDRGTGTPLYAMRKQRLQLPGLHYDEGQTTLPATPWPLSWDAASLHWAIGNTVTTWARHLAETRGIDPPERKRVLKRYLHVERNRMYTVVEARRLPVLQTAAAWLLKHVDAVRLDEAAAQIHDEITSIADAIERAIDREDPGIFAGRCDSPDVAVNLVGELLVTTIGTCGADLYADIDDGTEVKCTRPGCGAVYDLKARTSDMAKKVDDEWARPQLIADALTKIDEPVNASTLRTWIERDAKLAKRLRTHGGDAAHPLILQVGIDDDGRALYRVGDVRARIAALKAARPDRITA